VQVIGCHSSQVTTLQANRPRRFVVGQMHGDRRFASIVVIIG
jgi:hypothetical protein